VVEGVGREGGGRVVVRSRVTLHQQVESAAGSQLFPVEEKQTTQS
jgi:hypothetical protein